MSNISILNNIIDNRYDTYNVLHRKHGVVKTVLSFARAIVEVDNRELNLLNKTGEVLEMGNGVWIYYWHDIASGYIAVRIGAIGKKAYANVTIDKAAVMPAPTPNNIYSNAKIYSDEVWNSTIQAQTQYIDDNNNLSFQTGSGVINEPHFNLFLMNGFPAVMIPYLADFYHGSGGYVHDNRRYILEHLNIVNHRLFSSKILFRGTIGLNDMYQDPQDYYGALTTVTGDLKFEIAAFTDRYMNYYRPAVKVTCNGNEYLVNYNNVYSDDTTQIIPKYDSEQDVLSNVSMVLVSSSTIRYESLQRQTNQVGIAIRARKQDGTYGWGLITSRTLSSNYNLNFITAEFGSIDEYYYCLCVLG